MSDWIKLVFDFKNTMAHVAGDEKTEHLKSPSSLVTLLRLVAQSNEKNAYHRIENNILHAALHINVMNSIAFSEQQLPDLPGNVHKSQYP